MVALLRLSPCCCAPSFEIVSLCDPTREKTRRPSTEREHAWIWIKGRATKRWVPEKSVLC